MVRMARGRVFLPLAMLAMLVGMPALRARPAPACTLRDFATADGRLAYRDCERGTPVVIIPGGPGLDAEYTAGLATMIAGDGERAILLEPRGTGASRAAFGDGHSLSIAGGVADIEALRVALGARRIVLLGHSFGGAFAQAYAAAHPEHVARLVLLDSVGPSFAPPPHPLDSWRATLSAGELARYDALRAGGDAIGAMRIKFRASFVHPDRGAAFVAAFTDGIFHADVAARIGRDRDYDVRADARRHFPVAIVAGDMDWIRGQEPALFAVWPGARHLLIAEAGHFPWLDSPEASRAALHKALRR
jgi:proline iminopeptidase